MGACAGPVGAVGGAAMGGATGALTDFVSYVKDMAKFQMIGHDSCCFRIKVEDPTLLPLRLEVGDEIAFPPTDPMYEKGIESIKCELCEEGGIVGKVFSRAGCYSHVFT